MGSQRGGSLPRGFRKGIGLAKEGLSMAQFFVGDIVKMKKKHPCGNDEWEVMRTGMDFRIRCLKCSRQVWLERPAFEKSVRKIIKQVSPD